MTGLWAERYRVRYLEGRKYFIFQNVQTGSVKHPAPIQWLVGAITPGLSVQAPSSAVVENDSSHGSAPGVRGGAVG